jgi:hypothetical protein
MLFRCLSVSSQQFIVLTQKKKNGSLPGHEQNGQAVDSEANMDVRGHDQNGRVVKGEANANVQGRDQIGQDVQGHGHCKRREKAKKHCNKDLPGYPNSLKNFRNQVLPRWYYYISSLNKPWDLVHPEHVHLAQLLWTDMSKCQSMLLLSETSQCSHL